MTMEIVMKLGMGMVVGDNCNNAYFNDNRDNNAYYSGNDNDVDDDSDNNDD
jgi:hypothetical protein